MTGVMMDAESMSAFARVLHGLPQLIELQMTGMSNRWVTNKGLVGLARFCGRYSKTFIIHRNDLPNFESVFVRYKHQ
jgi:hypothetical protein